jgi:hypothetical protein
MNSSPFYSGTGQPIPEPKLIPIRTDHDVLVSLCQLAEEQLAVSRHLLAAASTPKESRSSATVKTSARGYDLEVKSYADGVLPTAVDEAVAEYARAQCKLAALQLANWAATVDAVANGTMP